MKSILITGPSSNSGKTTITLALTRAISNRGYKISAFKAGPDFIDLRYLEMASGKQAGNLDIHLMGIDGVRTSLSMNYGEYGIVEGAMGYFDGIYNGFENSSYHISNELDIPTILVYRPKGEMFSVIPKIKGMVDFSGSKIKGIILNEVNERIYRLLREKIEEYIGVEVLGYLPKDKKLELESRYLGLVWPDNRKDSQDFISRAANIAEKTLSIDRILGLANEIQVEDYKHEGKRNIKVAIARDGAFNFYYRENLKLLENTCKVEYFSPIKDKEVPSADLIYLGGGYPELFKEELTANKDMIRSIREKAEEGVFILAEAGGFMYLVSSIEGHAMCNIFKGHSRMTNRLQRFGYVDMELREDTILGKKGDIIKGHEYHQSTIDIDHKPLFNISKPKDISRRWLCGYSFKNVLAYYQHINFLGNRKTFNHLLDSIENKRKRDKIVY
ncbi:MAG: cobyrinate a,c-diamide synthase [Tissierellaceae bacterium]